MSLPDAIHDQNLLDMCGKGLWIKNNESAKTAQDSATGKAIWTTERRQERERTEGTLTKRGRSRVETVFFFICKLRRHIVCNNCQGDLLKEGANINKSLPLTQMQWNIQSWKATKRAASSIATWHIPVQCAEDCQKINFTKVLLRYWHILTILSRSVPRYWGLRWGMWSMRLAAWPLGARRQGMAPKTRRKNTKLRQGQGQPMLKCDMLDTCFLSFDCFTMYWVEVNEFNPITLSGFHPLPQLQADARFAGWPWLL